MSTVPEAVSAYLAKIGAKGGRAKSARKAEAVRANAKKPRPNARGPRKIIPSEYPLVESAAASIPESAEEKR